MVPFKQKISGSHSRPLENDKVCKNWSHSHIGRKWFKNVSTWYSFSMVNSYGINQGRAYRYSLHIRPQKIYFRDCEEDSKFLFVFNHESAAWVFSTWHYITLVITHRQRFTRSSYIYTSYDRNKSQAYLRLERERPNFHHWENLQFWSSRVWFHTHKG